MKRVLIILLSLIMILSILGCSNGQGNVEDDKPMVLTRFENLEDLDDINYKTIQKGKDTETSVYLIDSGLEGPTIVAVAGTHGNEVAGWKAAELMLSYKPASGKLIIIPWANVVGVSEETRLTHDYLDLNRSYTGASDEEANELELVANEIIETIEEFDPVIVIDHHEARWFYADTPSMGNTIIFSPEAIDSAFAAAEIVEEFNSLGFYEKHPFAYVGPPEENSLNDYISKALDIPTYTIETTRLNDLDLRINQQIQFVKIMLTKFGMETSGREWIIDNDIN